MFEVMKMQDVLLVMGDEMAKHNFINNKIFIHAENKPRSCDLALRDLQVNSRFVTVFWFSCHAVA